MSVRIASSLMMPAGLNKVMQAFHGVSFTLAFRHVDGIDPNLQKLTYAEEFWDFICDNWDGSTYKFFVTAKGEAHPNFNYEPNEEKSFDGAGHDIVMWKLEMAVAELLMFQV